MDCIHSNCKPMKSSSLKPPFVRYLVTTVRRVTNASTLLGVSEWVFPGTVARSEGGRAIPRTREAVSNKVGFPIKCRGGKSTCVSPRIYSGYQAAHSSATEQTPASDFQGTPLDKEAVLGPREMALLHLDFGSESLNPLLLSQG